MLDHALKYYDSGKWDKFGVMPLKLISCYILRPLCVRNNDVLNVNCGKWRKCKIPVLKRKLFNSYTISSRLTFLNRSCQHLSQMLRYVSLLQSCIGLCSPIITCIEYFSVSSLHSSGWWMVNVRLREKARLAFFSASPRHFEFLNCETGTCCPGNSTMTLRHDILEQTSLFSGAKITRQYVYRNSDNLAKYSFNLLSVKSCVIKIQYIKRLWHFLKLAKKNKTKSRTRASLV